jgi:hypothetical protein
MSAQLPGQQVRKAALLLRGLGLFGVSRSFPFLSLPSSPALVPHTRRKHGCQGLYVLHRHSRRTSFPLMIRAHMLSSLPLCFYWLVGRCWVLVCGVVVCCSSCCSTHHYCHREITTSPQLVAIPHTPHTTLLSLSLSLSLLLAASCHSIDAVHSIANHH